MRGVRVGRAANQAARRRGSSRFRSWASWLTNKACSRFFDGTSSEYKQALQADGTIGEYQVISSLARSEAGHRDEHV
jgi:hypothetical protein